MSASPYRVRAESNRDEADEVDRGCPNGDLVAVVLLFWAASVARVAIAFARHETFGAEATLALFGVVLSPIILRGAGAWLLRRLLSSLGQTR